MIKWPYVRLTEAHSYRSALVDYPGEPPGQPTVSAVVPVYNEIAYIEGIVEMLAHQDYPALKEIWIVDCISDDGTYEELLRLKERDPRICVLRNPRRNQAAAINLGFGQARGEVLIRLDAHAQYAPGVIRQSAQALLKTGAGGVGAIARPLAPDTLIGRSITALHESRLGIGVAKFRQASSSGWIDTVWNGCYWRHVVEQVGLLREDLLRSEDNDYNARVRAPGYGLYLKPEIKAYYYPRQSLRGLWRQYLLNGIGTAQALFQNLDATRLRHLVPLAFVMGLVLLLAISIVWLPALAMLALFLSVYLVALVFSTIVAWRKKPGFDAFLLPLLLVVLHFGYAIGSLLGILQLGFRRSKGLLTRIPRGSE